MKSLVWLVRREFWENRAIWMVPAAMGAALTLAALFGKGDIDVLGAPEQSRLVGGLALLTFGAVFFLAMNIYSSWYLLDCLFADRKDRSVLFWKSLPVSDTATVLAKLFTGLVAIPLVYFLAADITTLLVAFIVSLRARSALVSSLWQARLWLQLQALWLYVIVTSALWYLPFAGWLMVVSAWAKRSVVLWSILPLLALYVLERWFLGTQFLGAALAQRTLGYVHAAFHGAADQSLWAAAGPLDSGAATPGNVWRWVDPVGFFSSRSMWGGVLVGIALVATAIQLRIRRSEM